MSSPFDGMADIFTQHLGDDNVVYTPSGGQPRTIRAIYFETPLSVNIDDSGAPSDNQAKELHVSATDVAAPAEGDHATVRGVTYRVVPPFRADGQGMTALSLVRES